MDKLSKYLDHTNLKQTATKNDIILLCKEAKKYNFASVCVNPSNVKLAALELKNTDVKVCTVVGFPLGSNTTETKIFETQNAIINGATEIDMVINISKLIDGDNDFVLNEINLIKNECNDLILKVIIETCLLNQEQKKTICKIINKSRADFIKTSTGFSIGGATIEDVKLMKQYCNSKIQIKASGGIRTYDDALQMIKNGANRIGTSNSVAICDRVTNGNTRSNY